ncbi:MAG: hypothetical protein AAF628_34835 [Planctomycetota bacterium]
MSRKRHAWVGVAIVATLDAQVQHPERALSLAVDLPDAATRREAARQLAGRDDVSLDLWVRLLRRFGRFGAVAPGLHRHEVALSLGGGRVAKTELFVHVPSGYQPDEPAPLLFAAHGTHDSGRNQHRPWAEVSEKLGSLILAPSDAGAVAGYGFSDIERDTAWAALRWARRRFNVDENRIFASGISRGGHLVWDLALRAPDRFAALVPAIGGPRLNVAAGQNNLRYLEQVAHLPIRDLQGAKDDPALLANLRWAFARLGDWDATDAELIEFAELGHDFEWTAVDWLAFLGGARRQPLPDRVVRLAVTADTRAGRARAFWLDVLQVEPRAVATFRPRVSAAQWERLDTLAQRRLVQRQVDARTGRLEVSLQAPGRFQARGHGVARFRLLLTEDMLDADGGVQVRFSGKSVRAKPQPNALTLLTEFVERFDRTFLPVAEVVVP